MSTGRSFWWSKCSRIEHKWMVRQSPTRSSRMPKPMSLSYLMFADMGTSDGMFYTSPNTAPAFLGENFRPSRLLPGDLRASQKMCTCGLVQKLRHAWRGPFSTKLHAPSLSYSAASSCFFAHFQCIKLSPASRCSLLFLGTRHAQNYPPQTPLSRVT